MKFLPLFAGAAVVCILIGAYFLFDARRTPSSSEVPEIVSSTTPSVNPGYVIEQVPIGPSLPNLDRAIVFSDSTPVEARAIMEKNVDTLTARLKLDPTNGGDWFDLAIVYHQANDYDGARLIWEYLAAALPEDTTALDNLGKLYHYALKDFPESESSFKKSLARNPELTTPYLELFNLYRYSYKTETSAAVDIMSAMKQKFPGNTDSSMLLGGYYRDRKDYAHARVEYEAALDMARQSGDVALVGAIGEELSSLPQ